MKMLQTWTAFLHRPRSFRKLLPTVFLVYCAAMSCTATAFGEDDPLMKVDAEAPLAEESPSSEKQNSPPTLAPILVRAPPLDFTTGESSLSSEMIRQLPSGNGSIFDLLPVLPGIQLSEQAHPSAMGGEIDSPRMSIAGGKIYQNNILLDGLSITNRLDPLADDPEAANKVPERLQEVLPNYRIIEAVQVLDHNIPARYGGFTGGVVKLQTRMPQPEAGGSLNYRTTRDGWTKFHISAANRSKFENSNDVEWQPHFLKSDVGFDVNLPFSPGNALIFAYQLNQSRIPLDSIDGKKTRNRRQENFFLKWVGEFSARDTLELTMISAPFSGDYFLVNVKDSEIAIDKKAFTLNSTWHRNLAWVRFELLLGYGYNRTARSAPDNFFTWLVSDSKDWGRLNGSTLSLEGGHGNLATDQQQYHLQTNWDMAPWESGSLRHILSGGMELERTETHSERKKTSYDYWKPLATDPSILCEANDDACINGEQFSNRRTVYAAHDAHAAMTVGSVYLEDRISLSRLEVRPGVRLSRDTYLYNTNVAPRLASTLDLFGTRETILVAGMNRYYGLPVLANNLRNKQTFWEEKRILATDPWLLSKTTLTSSGSELKNPYVDELTAGLNQFVLGGWLRLNYIRRDGRDEFAKESSSQTIDGQVFTTIALNNNGRSHYDSYRASWNRSWSTTAVSLNITNQRSDTSVEDYDTSLFGVLLNRRIWYQGDVLFPEDLPRKDYNRSWVANMVLVKQMPFNVEFTNVTKYRSGYHYIGNTRVKAPAPNDDLYIYEDIHQRQSWLFDWKIAWRKKLAPHFEPALIVEINNVFNRKILIGSEDDEYEQGRQFWAGMECKF